MSEQVVKIFPEYNHELVPTPLEEKGDKIVLWTQDSKGNKFKKEYTPFGDKFDKDGAEKAVTNFGNEAKMYFDSLRNNLVKILTAETVFSFEEQLMSHLDKGWEMQGSLSQSPRGFSILLIKNKK